MVSVVLDASGSPLRLGAKLGDGGEGTVFEVASRNGLVAKIYHNVLDATKQNKIRDMVPLGDAKLLNFTAWPMEVLTDQANGKIVGFLMPKVSGMTPLHEAYSPAHRRQDHPDWGWNFLVFVARNLAAAFHSVHEHGHVLGDVNQGNAFVSAKSKVVLIDCDSYQVDSRGHKHLCEVGVSHFTPPELQGISSFKNLVRTPNHDNFGLALLIFHTLFGGRHPFAGVPQKNGVGDSLEDNIKNFRFAYSPSASTRHILPPPKSIPLSILPPNMAKMFDIAFTEEGKIKRRPTAKEWVDALDNLRENLKTCTSNSGHHYFKHLHACPWCDLEKQGVIYFSFSASTGGGPTPVFTGDINKLWLAIQSIQPLISITLPTTNASVLTPTPYTLPDDTSSANGFWYAVVAAGFLGLLTAAPQLIIIWLIVGGMLIGKIENRGKVAMRAERQKRAQESSSAGTALQSLIKQMEREAGITIAHQIIEDMGKLKRRHDSVVAEEQRAITDCERQAHQHQLLSFLDKFYIEKAKLSGIGPMKLATLRSFGIETAADIEWDRIINIRGFGEVLTRTLVDWRKSKERTFKFHSANGITDNYRKKIKQKYVSIRQDIEHSMREGLTKLQHIRQQVEIVQRRHQVSLQAAFDRKAKAEMDYNA